MKNLTNIGKFDELLQTSSACVKAFEQAMKDKIGNNYIDSDIELRISSIRNNRDVVIEFYRPNIRYECFTEFLGFLKEKMRLFKSSMTRKVVIYHDCIIILAKQSFGNIDIKYKCIFSDEHCTLTNLAKVMFDDFFTDGEMNELYESLNESLDMLFESKIQSETKYVFDKKKLKIIFDKFEELCDEDYDFQCDGIRYLKNDSWYYCLNDDDLEHIKSCFKKSFPYKDIMLGLKYYSDDNVKTTNKLKKISSFFRNSLSSEVKLSYSKSFNCYSIDIILTAN